VRSCGACGRRYDLVLDAQGLLKSAAVTALARRAAAPVCRGGRHVNRWRRWCSAARCTCPVAHTRWIGCGACSPVPWDIRCRPACRTSASDRPAGAGHRCVLLHGTTWASKLWPAPFWHDLAGRAAAAGYEVRLPWGDDAEHAQALQIAAGTPARVLERMSLDALADELAAAALVVGVDSGPAHLAAALGTPTVVIFGSTDRALTGARGHRAVNLAARFPCSPCLQRECRYRGPGQTWEGELIVPACYVSVPPWRVWAAATELREPHG
jgi:heptosyltransferase I